MRLATPRHASARSRLGITLVEILVVVSIIAILLALTGAGLTKAVEGQRNRTTKERLYKLQQSLDMEYERVVRQCAEDHQKGRIPKGFLTYAEGNPERALAIWTASNLRRDFPTTFFEAINGLTVLDETTGAVICRLEPRETFARFNSGTRNTNGAWMPNAGGLPEEESGALLYIILNEKSLGGAGAMAAAGDDLSTAQRRKVNLGSGELETFADAWGNTVGFQRWYADAEVQQSPWVGSASAGSPDPLDPRNLVYGWTPDPRNKKTQMQGLLQFSGQNRLITVYSIGKDQQQGSTDDMYGFRLKRFGNLGGGTQ